MTSWRKGVIQCIILVITSFQGLTKQTKNNLPLHCGDSICDFGKRIDFSDSRQRERALSQTQLTMNGASKHFALVVYPEQLSEWTMTWKGQHVAIYCNILAIHSSFWSFFFSACIYLVFLDIPQILQHTISYIPHSPSCYIALLATIRYSLSSNSINPSILSKSHLKFFLLPLAASPRQYSYKFQRSEFKGHDKTHL